MCKNCLGFKIIMSSARHPSGILQHSVYPYLCMAKNCQEEASTPIKPRKGKYQLVYLQNKVDDYRVTDTKTDMKRGCKCLSDCWTTI